MQTLFRVSLTCLIITDHAFNTGPRPGSPTVVSGKESESKSSNVSLACLIDYGWACPQRLFWTLNNTAHLSERAEKYEIQVKDTQSKCKKEFILSIFNVTEHDEGTYSCQWQCKYSGSMEAAIDLKITDEPQIGKSFKINNQCK